MGDGVVWDMSKALHWYELAAGQGSREAQYSCARLYEAGTHADLEKARYWREQLARQGVHEMRHFPQ